MNKEEKETIMKNLIIISDWSDKIVDDETIDNVSKLLDIVLKFQIENEIQQKEIEELKELLEDKTMRISFENIDNFIRKDKIKEKIKELEQIKNTALTGRTVEMMEDKINILNLVLEESK